MEMTVRQVADRAEKQRIARRVLEALTDWFEVPETRENYIIESAEQVFFAAFDGDSPAGFLCLKETGRNTTGRASAAACSGRQRRKLSAGDMSSCRSRR